MRADVNARVDDEQPGAVTVKVEIAVEQKAHYARDEFGRVPAKDIPWRRELESQQ